MDKLGAIGGGGNLDELKSASAAKISQAQSQANTEKANAQSGTAGDAAKSVGGAQGAQAQQQYPKL